VVLSTTETGHHDIAESGVKHNKSNQIKSNLLFDWNNLEGAIFFIGKISSFVISQQFYKANCL
jgi:hypothetical protein